MVCRLLQAIEHTPLKIQLSPDFQFIHNPGYNKDRGPARFWGIRLHMEY